MCACDQLRRVTRGVTARYDTGMVASGLKPTQLPIFVGLGSEGDLPLSVFAEKLALDRTTLTRNLKVLEDRGLIRTYEHAEDARVRMVSLDARGLGDAEGRAGALGRGPGRRRGEVRT